MTRKRGANISMPNPSVNRTPIGDVLLARDSSAPATLSRWGAQNPGTDMFDPNSFIRFCIRACDQPNPWTLIHAELLRIVADPSAIARPPEGNRQAWRLHQSPTLTILHTTYPRSLKAIPHNHGTWAVVSVYQGQEDYVSYARAGTELTPITTTSIRPGEAVILHDDAIHDLSTSAEQPTCSIHVYGGDLFDARRRSMWAPPEFQEAKFDDVEFARAWPKAAS